MNMIKCVTATLLILSASATACHAFVAPVVVSRQIMTTPSCLEATKTTVSKDDDPDKHTLKQVFPTYTKPDPTPALGKVGQDGKQKLTQVFPDFTKPDPVGPLGSVGDNTPKGLHPVFPAYERPDPAATLGQVGEEDAPPPRDKKHKLTQVFPPFTEPGSSAPLGNVGQDDSSKKGLGQFFPKW